jgi:hypothetical protein
MSWSGAGTVYNVAASVAGVTMKTVAIDLPEATLRVRLVISGTEVRFYALDSPDAPAFYVSPVAPQLPMRAYARIEPNGAAENEVQRVMMTTDPLPTTIFSAAQQQQYYGGLKNPVRVRISQHSGVREVGYGPPFKGAI